jgi:uncharacterized protein (DUF427 family)
VVVPLLVLILLAAWAARPPRVEKGGDHHGRVERQGVSRQLEQLRRAVPDQGPARGGEQLEEAAHGIRGSAHDRRPEGRDLEAVARRRPSADHPVWTEPYPRRVRAFLDDVAVADSDRALLLLEAMHLPVYYFPPEDVRTDLLEPTDRSTHCPYKGDASYWSVIVGDRVEEDIAWSYPFPIPECPKIQNLVAFFNERADIWVDGELQLKPETPWSRQPAR